jgi:hypothetical protein
MARLLRWFILIVGIAMILMFLAFFASITVMMGPFGGVPYSWSLLSLNLGWVAFLAAGMILVATASWMFRQRDR